MCVCAVNQQLDNSRPPPTLTRQPLAVSADSAEAYSSPRRKARSTPRHLSERQRQRRVYHQHKMSPDASTDEAPAEVVRSPRGRRRELRSKIPVLERSCTFSTAAETAASTVAAVARPRTSDDSA